MDSCAKLKKLIQTANELLDKRVTADLPEFKTWHASALRFLTNELGLLGRNNTILIKSDNSIELPGDLDGIVYSDSANEFMIAKELKSMGFDIDLNKIL